MKRIIFILVINILILGFKQPSLTYAQFCGGPGFCHYGEICPGDGSVCGVGTCCNCANGGATGNSRCQGTLYGAEFINCDGSTYWVDFPLSPLCTPTCSDGSPFTLCGDPNNPAVCGYSCTVVINTCTGGRCIDGAVSNPSCSCATPPTPTGVPLPTLPPPTSTPVPTSTPIPTDTPVPTSPPPPPPPPPGPPPPSISCSFNSSVPLNNVPAGSNVTFTSTSTASNTSINWFYSGWSTTAGNPTPNGGNNPTLNWSAPSTPGTYPATTIHLDVDDGPGGATPQGCDLTGPMTVTNPPSTPTPTVPPTTVSCSVSPSSAGINQNVNWNGFASGGTGSYSYSWTDTKGGSRVFGPTGAASDTWSRSYPTTGPVTATVTVTAGTTSPPCQQTINVTALPWLKTFGGDVHTNQGINTPGGP